MIQANVLEKLEWPLLLNNLARFCQTKDGENHCLNLVPNLTKSEILLHWDKVKPLKELNGKGHRPPIGEITSIDAMLRSASLGQILLGVELRTILQLLESTQRVILFSKEFFFFCPILDEVKQKLTPLSSLANAITRSVDENGELTDQASPELADLRKQKRNLKKRIEEKLKSLLKNEDVMQYLQDEFFTVRLDRYVIPISLDGRGRIRGSIVDTSQSGQTLFIEPSTIAPLNETLQELELSEKLEMIRIFKKFSEDVATYQPEIRTNYEELIKLDILNAQGELANSLACETIELKDTPMIDLKSSRHPLIKNTFDQNVVSNDVELQDKNRILILSGPNAGGKTVILKTIGLIQLMAKAGLLLPVRYDSQLYIYKNIYCEMGDAQNLSASLSTFSGHIQGLKPILEKANKEDLVLLDELTVGTEPQTGAALAQSILEDLAERGTSTIVTTHYDNLKGLAIQDKRFRNASMEYSLKDFKPTYKMLMDLPGQSYGLEVASKGGLSPNIIARARNLRGSAVSTLDQFLQDLSISRQEFEKRNAELQQKLQDAVTAKNRWEHEVALLTQRKQEIMGQVAQKYEKELSTLRESFQSSLKELSQKVQNASQENIDEVFTSGKKQSKTQLDEFQKVITQLNMEANKHHHAALPGRPCQLEELKQGDRVYIIGFKKEGVITRPVDPASHLVDVEAGHLKVKVPVSGLRILNRK